MQVFMPFSDINQSLFALDKIRLCKQRTEAKQVIDIIDNNIVCRWSHHPVTKMYRNYVNWLKYYYNQSLMSFESRGGHNEKLKIITHGPVIDPPWIGQKQFHQAHQAHLMVKAINDSNGIGAAGQRKKPNAELLLRLRFFGITPDTVSMTPETMSSEFIYALAELETIDDTQT